MMHLVCKTQTSKFMFPLSTQFKQCLSSDSLTVSLQSVVIGQNNRRIISEVRFVSVSKRGQLQNL